MSFPARDNTILWADVSEKFIDAFNLVKQRMYPQPADALIYMMDGKFVRLPIARRLGKKDYKTPHWLPVTFQMKTPSEMDRA